MVSGFTVLSALLLSPASFLVLTTVDQKMPGIRDKEYNLTPTVSLLGPSHQQSFMIYYDVKYYDVNQFIMKSCCKYFQDVNRGCWPISCSRH